MRCTNILTASKFLYAPAKLHIRHRRSAVAEHIDWDVARKSEADGVHTTTAIYHSCEHLELSHRGHVLAPRVEKEGTFSHRVRPIGRGLMAQEGELLKEVVVGKNKSQWLCCEWF